jgi:hypothetical protein
MPPLPAIAAAIGTDSHFSPLVRTLLCRLGGQCMRIPLAWFWIRTPAVVAGNGIGVRVPGDDGAILTNGGRDWAPPARHFA